LQKLCIYAVFVIVVYLCGFSWCGFIDDLVWFH